MKARHTMDEGWESDRASTDRCSHPSLANHAIRSNDRRPARLSTQPKSPLTNKQEGRPYPEVTNDTFDTSGLNIPPGKIDSGGVSAWRSAHVRVSGDSPLPTFPKLRCSWLCLSPSSGLGASSSMTATCLPFLILTPQSDCSGPNTSSSCARASSENRGTSREGKGDKTRGAGKWDARNEEENQQMKRRWNKSEDQQLQIKETRESVDKTRPPRLVKTTTCCS